jgi:hypothetical protein
MAMGGGLPSTHGAGADGHAQRIAIFSLTRLRMFQIECTWV